MITRTGIAMLLCACAGSVHAAGFALSSPDIKPKATIKAAQVFNGFGCTGDNISPALVWKNPPKGTKSFALQVHDPDAPTGGSGWWHWVVFNLPADATGLAQGVGDPAAGRLPAGAIQSRTDFGVPGWGGPCPPPGDKPHRYVFTVHALGLDRMGLEADAPAAMVGFTINAHRLGSASFTAYFGR